MRTYFIKRILLFIPALVIIALLSFVLSENAPGDPVYYALGGNTDGNISASQDASEKNYLLKRAELGLNKPLFYFSLASFAECDTIYKIAHPEERKALKRLIDNYGNWPKIQLYFLSLKKTIAEIQTSKTGLFNKDKKTEILAKLSSLKSIYATEIIEQTLAETETIENQYIQSQSVKQTIVAFQNIKQNKQAWKNYIPTLHYYGIDCRFHHWLSGLMVFDFGISYQDKRPIKNRLSEALTWTLIINSISVVIIYLLAIPLGIFMAKNTNKAMTIIVDTILFILYALPNFLIATLLLIYFCGGDYFAWFPSHGVQDMQNENWTIFEKTIDIIWRLCLPIFCTVYSGISLLSKQQRVAIVEIMQFDFIRTARAKGLTEKKVLWIHALKNSLLPAIALFASVFPALISGSVIIETLFSIPGMGFLTYNAILSRDYPVIVAVFTLSGILTLVGQLVADALYALIDPRVRMA